MTKRKKEHQFNSILIDEPIQIKHTDKLIDVGKLSFDFKYKTKTQKEYVNLIEQNQIIICTGPAGVGKSFLSIGYALQALKEHKYNKIFLITPAIESEEKLGFLPGDLMEKLQPYLYSTYYLIDKLIGKPNRLKLVQNGFIEPIAIGFLRGINIDDSILIFEEAQNSSIKTMKTLLTRIGKNSKFIISGDIDQIDNDKIKKINDSGLHYGLENLSDITDIGLFKFNEDKENFIRNPLISEILKKFPKTIC